MPAPKKIPSISPTAINAYLLTLASRNVRAEKKQITKTKTKTKSQKGGKKKRKTQKRRK